MSLFGGREDVFARRWEKWDKSIAIQKEIGNSK